MSTESMFKNEDTRLPIDQSSPKNPFDDLEYQWKVTDPSWGKEIVPELKAKLREILYEQGQLNKETGEITAPIEPLWELLAMYTKDIRLGNLKTWPEDEVGYVTYYLDLARDCLSQSYVRTFTCCMSRAISKLEVSQSRDGFFRKRTNTITSEKYESKIPDEKNKDWLGRAKEVN